jgi:hypothetical protein
MVRRIDDQVFLNWLNIQRKPTPKWLNWGCKVTLSDYRYISAIEFLGLAEHIYFGINEIHEISVFSEKPT